MVAVYDTGHQDNIRPNGQSYPDPISDAVRSTVRDDVFGRRGDLDELSMFLHANPELLWTEVKAHAKLTQYLAKHGVKVTNYPSIPTAFRVSYTHGEGGRTFGLNSEYDALPDIGHGCGHNLIAVSGIGAFLAMRAAMIKHDIAGTVVLLGTPAEEGGAGKQVLLDLGAYDDMGACMMLHPGVGKPGDSYAGPSLASRRFYVEFYGKPAHAAGRPWEGVNALDAAQIAYFAISCLRQQIKPAHRLHCVITEGGNTSPHIICPYAKITCGTRAPSWNEVLWLTERIEKCIEGAAIAARVTYKTTEEMVMKDLVNDDTLAMEYGENLNKLFGTELKYTKSYTEGLGGSTDFGNVTQVLPGCHPKFNIPTTENGAAHTHEFAHSASLAESHEYTYQSTVAMACTGIRYLMDEAFAQRTRESFEANKTRLGF